LIRNAGCRITIFLILLILLFLQGAAPDVIAPAFDREGKKPGDEWSVRLQSEASKAASLDGFEPTITSVVSPAFAGELSSGPTNSEKTGSRRVFQFRQSDY
jgi:hypothetical protein